MDALLWSLVDNLVQNVQKETQEEVFDESDTDTPSKVWKLCFFMQHLHGTECLSIFIFKLDL